MAWRWRSQQVWQIQDQSVHLIRRRLWSFPKPSSMWAEPSTWLRVKLQYYSWICTLISHFFQTDFLGLFLILWSSSCHFSYSSICGVFSTFWCSFPFFRVQARHSSVLVLLSYRCIHSTPQRTVLLQLYCCRLSERLHGPLPVQEQKANNLQPRSKRPRWLCLHIQWHCSAAGGGWPCLAESAGELPTLWWQPKLQRLLRIPAVCPLTDKCSDTSWSTRKLNSTGLIHQRCIQTVLFSPCAEENINENCGIH